METEKSQCTSSCQWVAHSIHSKEAKLKLVFFQKCLRAADYYASSVDNKYGRAALEATMKTIMGYEAPLVPPSQDYKGDFFKDVADALVGVGLICNSENMPGVLMLDKDYITITILPWTLLFDFQEYHEPYSECNQKYHLASPSTQKISLGVSSVHETHGDILHTYSFL